VVDCLVLALVIPAQLLDDVLMNITWKVISTKYDDIFKLYPSICICEFNEAVPMKESFLANRLASFMHEK
jgi:hypothetical protein